MDCKKGITTLKKTISENKEDIYGKFISKLFHEIQRNIDDEELVGIQTLRCFKSFTRLFCHSKVALDDEIYVKQPIE